MRLNFIVCKIWINKYHFIKKSVIRIFTFWLLDVVGAIWTQRTCLKKSWSKPSPNPKAKRPSRQQWNSKSQGPKKMCALRTSRLKSYPKKSQSSRRANRQRNWATPRKNHRLTRREVALVRRRCPESTSRIGDRPATRRRIAPKSCWSVGGLCQKQTYKTNSASKSSNTTTKHPRTKDGAFTFGVSIIHTHVHVIILFWYWIATSNRIATLYITSNRVLTVYLFFFVTAF